MRNSLSSLIMGIIVLFLVVMGVGYIYLVENMTKNYTLNQKNIILNVQTKTENLLAELLHLYLFKKDEIISKHKATLEYITSQKTDPLKLDLAPIFKKLNQNYEIPHYNIYITDDNLTIKNTTFIYDKNFSLSFAKATFDLHKKRQIIGVSTPLLEFMTQKFFSYSDSYIGKSSKILQLSYTYEASSQKFKEVQNLLKNYPDIVDFKSYIILNDGFVNKIDFGINKNKQKLQSIIKKSQIDAKNILKTLEKKPFRKNSFIVDNKEYETLYFAIDNPILKDAKVLYSITFDKSKFNQSVKSFKISFAMITIFGIVGIIFLWNLRRKELRLSLQEQFLRSAMHEIQTPLSVITLYHEVQTIKNGENKYTKEIDNALKVLENSYKELGYALLDAHKDYPVTTLSLEEIAKQRVEYFHSMAHHSRKKIELKSIDSSCTQISKVELSRLIDNTLSNALKYSKVHSTIEVEISKNRLCITNIGSTIKNPKKIFRKYYRENSAKGGFGLGLFIVQEIAKKYDIKIELYSKNNTTKFCYIFKESKCI